MSLGVAEWFVALALTGLGLLLAGGINVALRRANTGWRAFVSASAGAGAASAAWAWSGNPTMVGVVGGLVAVGVTACLLVGSARRGSGATPTGRHRGPVVGWGVLGTLGLLIVVGTGVAYTVEDEAAIDRNMTELGFMGPEIALRSTSTRIVTDRGTTFAVRKFLAPEDAGTPDPAVGGPAGAGEAGQPRRYSPTNCHGWVFTGGLFWLEGRVVEQILEDNGYEPVTTPRPDDLTVYRAEGEIVHTAIVRSAEPGQPVMVEGKFGAREVSLHPVDQSMYGTDFTYYRSPRPGHLVAILDASDLPDTDAIAE
jgi:hypothetical protein